MELRQELGIEKLLRLEQLPEKALEASRVIPSAPGAPPRSETNVSETKEDRRPQACCPPEAGRKGGARRTDPLPHGKGGANFARRVFSSELVILSVDAEAMRQDSERLPFPVSLNELLRSVGGLVEGDVDDMERR